MLVEPTLLLLLLRGHLQCAGLILNQRSASSYTARSQAHCKKEEEREEEKKRRVIKREKEIYIRSSLLSAAGRAINDVIVNTHRNLQ